MRMFPLYHNHVFIPDTFRYGNYYCPNCGEPLTNTTGERLIDQPESFKEGICSDCTLKVVDTSVFVVFTTDKYHGTDQPCNDTVTLLINGEKVAMAHIEESGGDSGADVAHMHLGYIREEDQTEYIAKIISDFAKWVRFDWRTLDKKSEFPTLVRLMGCITDRNKHWKNQHSWFVALPNAVDIKVEHLKWDFTQKERIQHE